MPTGPIKKPAKLQARDGNPGSHLYTPDWTTPLKELPAPHGHLGRSGTAHWNRIGTELVADGLIAERDLINLHAMCELFDVLDSINKELMKKNEIMIDRGAGKAPLLNPLHRFKVQILQQIRQSSQEFGLSPSSRARPGFRQTPTRAGASGGNGQDSLAEFMTPRPTPPAPPERPRHS